MRIKIDDTYSITTDPMNYILTKKKVVQDGVNKGNVYYEAEGYYSTLSGALKGYLVKELRSSDCESIPEVLDKIEELENKIDNILKGY